MSKSLVLHIIESHFGPHASSVAKILFERGRVPLGLIAKGTQLSVKQIKESLVVLIQHSLVTFADSKENARIVTYYSLNTTQVLLKDRIPAYLHTCLELFGEAGLAIARELSIHGKCDLATLLTSTKSSKDQDKLQKSFQKMLSEGYITVADPSDCITLVDKVMTHEKESFEKAGVLTATEKKKLKEKLLAERELNLSRGSSTSAKRKIVRDIDEVSSKKIKTEDISSATQSSETEIATSYYKLNTDKFHLYYRSKDIQSLAKARINNGAGLVIQAMCELAHRSMHGCKGFDRSVPIKVNSIAQMVPENELPIEGPYHSSPYLSYLETLSADEVSFVYKDDETNGGAYSIHLAKVTYALKLNTVQDILHAKFGPDGVRIWRCLLKGKLDDKQVAKLCMIPMKTTREILYKMFKLGYIDMQDVPKTADHSASRTFFLYGVDPLSCFDVMLRDMYETLSKLKQRRISEYEKHDILLEKLSRTDVQNNEDLLGHMDKQERKEMEQVYFTLRSAEEAIDRCIMCLRDY